MGGKSKKKQRNSNNQDKLLDNDGEGRQLQELNREPDNNPESRNPTGDKVEP